jgi:hypothetical protein
MPRRVTERKQALLTVSEASKPTYPPTASTSATRVDHCVCCRLRHFLVPSRCSFEKYEVHTTRLSDCKCMEEIDRFARNAGKISKAIELKNSQPRASWNKKRWYSHARPAPTVPHSSLQEKRWIAWKRTSTKTVRPIQTMSLATSH